MAKACEVTVQRLTASSHGALIWTEVPSVLKTNASLCSSSSGDRAEEVERLVVDMDEEAELEELL